MNINLFLALLLILTMSQGSLCRAAEEEKPLAGAVEDRFREAQEKLLHAKGSYKTIRMQEEAIQNMRRATKLSLRAARLRAKAERMQNKADALVNKANLAALSRGLYITNPLAPVMMQPPPEVAAQPATSPVTPPVPGQPINVTIPQPQEVSENSNNNNYLPSPPSGSGF
ncbi:MAG: hypothetical protein HY094_06145 [Candidatus Melainabacteria bacterium]|nr:hypothetical protein [Candidatus Melainabacteria bacterium]